jgi:lysophospholipase L1-like esterase
MGSDNHQNKKIEKLDKNFASAGPGKDLRWVDIRELTLEGQGWQDTESPYDRLPGRAKERVRAPVWHLSHYSAGLVARFVTDAPAICVRWALRNKNLAMSHMPASGVSGVDLYVRQEGRWHWLGVGRPVKQVNELAIVEGLDPVEREYRLYLPLYNGVTAVQVGVPERACLRPAAPLPGRPIVFYGTSIVQGGVASRPGMAYPAILSRRLDRAHINLGFSGNGHMEQELAELLGELDACAYVLDSLPNMSPELTGERLAPFVRTLRRRRPRTPIVLVENITYANAAFVQARRQRCVSTNAAMFQAYRALTAEGVGGLHLQAGDVLLGADGEATVDGTHPTDLGFIRIADALESVLRPVV